MGHHAHVIEELAGPTNDLRRAQPEAWTAFNALHRAAMADGAVPRRIKELIALAVAVSEHCDGCIAYHAKAAARHGASREEVGEVLSHLEASTIEGIGFLAAAWVQLGLAVALVRAPEVPVLIYDGLDDDAPLAGGSGEVSPRSARWRARR
jgi:AhpD family alkylhydroperoxidase